MTKTGVTESVDDDLKAVVTGTKAKVDKKMDDYHVNDCLTEIFALFRRCNKYIDETEPWVIAKDEAKADRLKEVMYNLTESIIIGATLLAPFMPSTSEKILAQLNQPARDFGDLDKFGLLESGAKVCEKPEILFARLDIKDVMEKVEKIREAQKAEYEKENGIAPAEDEKVVDNIEAKDEIEYGDFDKLQFRVGKIIKCEAVPKSKKLLCSQVKIGSEVKQIVSGIKQYYSPEEMVGKKVMVLCNLKPATLAGVKSEGMLLCAEDVDGNLALMVPEKDMPAGGLIC